MARTEKLIESFTKEYGSEDSVRKYSSATAGYGISYLLRNDYARIYREVVDSYLRTSPQKPLRVLEFGCGAGMNLIRLVPLLEERGIPVESALGTDFSERLIQSAWEEARSFLPAPQASKVRFQVAGNESLVDDLAANGKPVAELAGSFDLIFGVNTFRYCHRIGKQQECAANIQRLLRKGGVCIVIDMNDRFPAFRSHWKGTVEDPAERYLPSLAEYVSPFEDNGFEILRKGNFCWIPHSAGPALTACLRVLSPLLNLTMRSLAMRSLVVARKPA